MKRTTLERIAPLLHELRRHPALHEVRPALFTVNDRDFLHFHDEPDGIFADVRLARGLLRLPVSSAAEQAELLGQIDDRLSSLDTHVVGRRRRDHRGHRNSDYDSRGG